MVSAKVDDGMAAQVEASLNGFHAVSAADRGGFYREQGWSRFDEQAPAYTGEQVARERTLYMQARG